MILVFLFLIYLFFTFLLTAWEVFALRDKFYINLPWNLNTSSKKIISRLLINVPGIYLIVKKFE